MSDLVPNKQQRNIDMAVMYASGASQREIAKQYGLSQPAVSLALRSDEAVKQLIDDSTRAQVAFLPRVMQNYEEFLDPAQNDDKQVRLKACQDITKNTGLAPSNTQSITINNIMQTNNILADPGVLDALKTALAPEGDIIEVGS